MSSAVFYRSALERNLSHDTKRLFASLLARNERIEKMLDAASGRDQDEEETYDPLGENPSTSAQIRSMEKTVKMIVSLITFEDLFLKTALDSEKSALKQERELQESGEVKDKAMGLAILELREANVRELKEFQKKESSRSSH